MVLKLSNIIDYAGISQELGIEKPSPENFRDIKTYLKLDKYYYIGDNLKKDFVAPNALGWKTIGIIDNGSNIHYDHYLYRNETHIPGEFISCYSKLRIR